MNASNVLNVLFTGCSGEKLRATNCNNTAHLNERHTSCYAAVILAVRYSLRPEPINKRVPQLCWQEGKFIDTGVSGA